MAKNRELSDRFVHQFLESGTATPEDIDALIREHAPEGLRLEFKGGDWLAGKAPHRRGKPGKPGPRLCQYVAGFANAAGGVLVVGLEDKDDTAGPVQRQTCLDFAPDPDRLARAARDALQTITSQLAAPPLVHVIDHPDGMILVIGVHRSPTLVECYESGGQPVYYLRTEDGTAVLPDLVAVDLLVGRRARPALDLRMHVEPIRVGPQVADLRLRMEVRNEGLVWLDDVRVGVVWFPQSIPTDHPPIAGSLLSSVDSADRQRLAHAVAEESNRSWGALPPFAAVTGHASVQLPGGGSEWTLASYVVAPGQPPSWWETRGWIDMRPTLQLNAVIEHVRCTIRRPTVSWSSRER